MPEISVIIPTYNCVEYLPKAIDSVLGQTYQNFEIIIVDDGSTDNTKETIQNYFKNYPDKIRYFYQENRGLPGARNAGINVAKGDYIALLDADDEFIPVALEECLYFIEQNNAEWCIIDILREEGNRKDILNSNIPVNNYILYILDDCYSFIRRAFFFSKRTIVDVGLFDNTFKIFEDWDLYIRLIEANKKFVYINKPLYIYKIRKKSLLKNNTEKVLIFILQLLKRHHKRLADMGNMAIAKIYSKHMWNLSKRYLCELKDIKKTIYCIKESFKYDFNLNRLIHPLFFNLNKLVKKIKVHGEETQ